MRTSRYQSVAVTLCLFLALAMAVPHVSASHPEDAAAPDEPDRPPIIQCDVDGPYYAAPGVEITLSASIFGGAPPYNYSWDFGDGSPPEVGSSDAWELDVLHAWSVVGTFTVVLDVTDAMGEWTQCETQVYIAFSPVSASSWGMIKALYR